MGRIVVEVAGARRITREYDSDGQLLRILIEPVSRGPTPDLPPVQKQPFSPRAAPAKPKAKPAPPAPAAPPAAAPPRTEELPVVLSEMDAAPPPPPPPAPEARPPPPPRPKGFAIVAVEKVEPATAARTPAPTLEASLDKANETLERASPPAPASEPERAPEPAAPPAPAPPEPEPPLASLDVPDLEARVDALFQERQRSVKAKKRAPLPVPQFEPLQREAWEDRLEKVLGSTS